MDREDILRKAQEENKGRDAADIEAQHKGAYAAYFVGILLIVAVDIVELIALGRISYGANMAVFAMAFTAFLTKYLVLRKRHELVVSICYGAITALWLVLWIMQLTGVIG